MAEMDTSKRPDPTDLADDDIRALKDPEAREALYRMSEKIKACFLYYEETIAALYAVVTAIEEELP